MTAHRSKLLSQEDVNEAFMIIPVRRELAHDINDMFISSKSKFYFLNEDISDPWRQPVPVFRKCAEQIARLQDEVLETLVKIERNEHLKQPEL